LGRLGLLILSALLPLLLVSCAANPSGVTQLLPQSQGDLLLTKAVQPAPTSADNRDPLQVCAVVPEEELGEMRGCQGYYYFNFVMDINLTNPTPTVKTEFTASVPTGRSEPQFNGAKAYYAENGVDEKGVPNSVFYLAGPTPGGLTSELIVAGNNNIVFSNTEFNFHMPNAASLTPSVNVLSASSLSGIGVK
jgi:hypothetical protein